MGQLSLQDQDKMGEVSQTCMGHSATALHMMIGREVKISTPKVNVINRVDINNILMAFGLGSVMVQIDFKNDFHGSNMLMFKENDIKIIMDLMMGGSGVAVEGELNEMHLSCVSEVMNQMMGASAIALTGMIQKTVDINPPNAMILGSKADVEGVDFLPYEGEEFTLVVCHLMVDSLFKGVMVRIYPMEETQYICTNFRIRE